MKQPTFNTKAITNQKVEEQELIMNLAIIMVYESSSKILVK